VNISHSTTPKLQHTKADCRHSSVTHSRVVEFADSYMHHAIGMGRAASAVTMTSGMCDMQACCVPPLYLKAQLRRTATDCHAYNDSHQDRHHTVSTTDASQ
jgi:hypothetical protein